MEESNRKVTFLLTLIVSLGVIFISPIFTGFVSLLEFIVFFALIIIARREYSKKRLQIIISVTIVYLLVMVAPFPRCYSASYWSPKTTHCTCIGIEKHSFGIYDFYYSECIGIPINYVCQRRSPINGTIEDIPCDTPDEVFEPYISANDTFSNTKIVKKTVFNSSELAAYIDTCYEMTREAPRDFVCYILQGSFRINETIVKNSLSVVPPEKVVFRTLYFDFISKQSVTIQLRHPEDNIIVN